MAGWAFHEVSEAASTAPLTKTEGKTDPTPVASRRAGARNRLWQCSGLFFTWSKGRSGSEPLYVVLLMVIVPLDMVSVKPAEKADFTVAATVMRPDNGDFPTLAGVGYVDIQPPNVNQPPTSNISSPLTSFGKNRSAISSSTRSGRS